MATTTASAIPARNHGILILVLASLTAFLLTFLPFARIITYPFLIFSTFIHETFHAIAGVVTFGEVESLIVAWNGSGVTYVRGGFAPAVFSAGYVGTALFGGLLLLLTRNRSWIRPALLGCVILITTSTLFFVGHTNNLVVLAALGGTIYFLLASTTKQSVRFPYLLAAAVIASALLAYLYWTKSLFTWGVAIFLILGLLSIMRFASLALAHFFVSFLAIQCSLNAMDALKVLVLISTRPGCRATDATNMASITGIPAAFWAILWAAFSVIFLAYSLYRLAGKGK